MGGRSRAPWIFHAASVLGLIVGLAGMQGLLSRSAPPPGYPSNPILYPAHVGPAVAGSAAELRFLAESRPPGTVLEVRSDAGLVRARLEPQVSRWYAGFILLEGLVIFAVAFVVFAPRAERGPVRDLFLAAVLFGIATMIHGLHFPRGRSAPDWLFPAVWIACVTALPVLFLRATQTFPRPRRLLIQRPRLMRGIWLGAAILAAWQIAAAYHYFWSPTPGAWALLSLPRAIAQSALVLAVGVGCLTLYRTARALDLAREREQIRWMLWGIAIGVAPYALFRVLPRFAGIDAAVPPEVDRVFETAIPLAFAFAIVRPKFLDIDILIRRTAIYGLLTAALGAVYVLVGVVAAGRMPRPAPRTPDWMQLLAVALTVALVVPAKRWIEALVDRVFFKLQNRYARALALWREEIRNASVQEEILERTRAFVEAELRVDAAAALARRGSIILTSASGEWTHDARAMLAAASAPAEAAGAGRRLLAFLGSTMRPDLESPAFPPVLEAAGMKLALAAEGEDRPIGVLLVGDKKNGRRFTEEDLRLLYGVRAEMERALDRIESAQRAYDVILRGGDPHAAREGREPQHLEAPRDERTLARLDHVDLLPLVQEAVDAVEPAAQARRIRFDLSVSPHVRPVRGDRDLLFEIVTDLLDNAARYSPDGEAVDITIEPTRLGQMLIVRDRGPGIAESERERIFQRVEPGRRSTLQGRGHGLRLYVARLHLESMGGTIQARNHPGGGAMFVCTVPEYEEIEAHARA